MIGTFRGLARLFAEKKARWALLSLLVAATAGIEALAASSVFALVSLLAQGSIELPLVGRVTSTGGGLQTCALAVTCLFLLRAAVVVLRDVVLYRLCYGAGAELEQRLLLGYLSLPPREIRRRGRAELVRNVHDTVMRVVEECLIPGVLAGGYVLSAVAVIAVMLGVAPLATLVAAGVFGPVLWLIAWGVRRPVRRLGEQVERSLADSLSAATEALLLAGEIRMAGRSRDFGLRFGNVRRALARAGGAEEVFRSFPRLVAETSLVLFVLAYIAVATARGNEAAVLPTLGLFAYAALRVLPSLIGLVGLVHSIAHSGPALEIVLADEALLQDGGGARDFRFRPGVVTLHDVTVRLPENGREVLHGIQLELRQGDVVAVVGPNGAGKSTLLDVLSGALLPDEGVLTVDGRPLAEIEDSWPSQVAMVPQEVHLLDSDIPANITLDLSGSSSADPAVAEVVREVGLQQVIARLGERTVGEDGGALSGGERQRVAVARALYRPAGLLLVDEGTSGLDVEARSALLELLSANSSSRITVVVTHDPDVAARCTRSVRLENGRVTAEEALGGVQQGSLAGHPRTR
jgi:ATP-binding cassette, subfamily B, bacterial PglK